MEQKTKFSPGDFFMHLGATVLLYISIATFLNLVFSIINHYFADRQDYFYDPYAGGVRFALSVLVVVFPAYYFLARKLRKESEIHPEIKEYGVRKWLIYLTLFLASATLVVDFIVILNTFLGGEITIRFILKSLIVLLVAGGVFWYYGKLLKGTLNANSWMFQTFISVVWTALLFSIIFGFAVVGSPSKQRALKDDQTRVMDLSSVQWQIVNFYQTKKILPSELGELTDSISGYKAPVDPKTGMSYTYTKTGDLAFTLCAVFELPSVNNNESIARTVMHPGEETWEHGQGEECFDRTIDPERYPFYENLKY